MKARLMEIIHIVQKEKEVSVHDLSEALHVSEVTIRKDLDVLEKKGHLLRTHGGAVAITEQNAPSYFARINLAEEEKKRIAQAAAKLIEDGDSVIIDAGSTALAVAKCLKSKQVSIVTVSLPVGMDMHDYNGTISMTGGEILKGTLALTGPDTEAYLEKVQVNKVILGTSGFRLDCGFTTSSKILAAVKQKMIRAAQQVILVTDHTKFSKIKLSLFAEFGDIHTVVTSKAAPPEALAALRKHKIEVVLAD